MRPTHLLLVITFFSSTINAQIYKAKAAGTILSFFSKAPMENISALTKSAIFVLNTTTNIIQLRISVRNFKFKNSLMEENFNEDYLETEKFPNAIFIGKINEPIDYTKNANLKITVTGKLEIHGVTKQKTFEGTIKKSGNEITLTSNFNVNLADYSIKIPSLYAKNISEISNVEVKTILEPYIKK
jgi:hypothetical protein